METKFTDLKIGDVVIAADEASHDCDEYTILITEKEEDEDFVTETNPTGIHFYGECLDGDDFEDYITHVDEANFIKKRTSPLLKKFTIRTAYVRRNMSAMTYTHFLRRRVSVTHK